MSARKSQRSERPTDQASDDAARTVPRRGLPPRLLPPLIGLGLLVLVACMLLFRPSGPPEEKLGGKRVRQVEHAAEFTYLELDDDDGQAVWIAAPRSDVRTGDQVHFESAEEIRDFEARSLKRTFDRILFVPQLFKLDASGQKVALGSKSPSGEASPHGHGGVAGHGLAGHGTGGHGAAGHGAAAGPDVPIPRLERVDGGQTLAEMSADVPRFGGREVKIRGVIVSALPKTRASFDQPPTNWYRLRDRTDNKEPLVFTSDETLQRGDVVVVSGKLALDRDFGGGMRYKLIIEGARVAREKAAEAPIAKPSASTKAPSTTAPADQRKTLEKTR